MLKNFTFITILIYTFLLGTVVLATYYLCGKSIVYTLDDPYIHLSVAENIMRGGYGVNLEEPSSPSSSIIYPFILILAKIIGLGSAGPLILNIIAGYLVIYFSSKFVNKHILMHKEFNIYDFIIWSFIIIFSTSAVALPMTGMEHIWHVFFVILAVYSLAELKYNINKKIYISVFFMPLIRFEGFALSFGIILAALLTKKFKESFFLLLVTCIPSLLFIMYLHSLGLPILPSSILLKHGTATAMLMENSLSSSFFELFKNLNISLKNRFGVIILIAFGLISIKYFLVGNQKNKFLYISFCLAIFGHILFGKYGWFSRYEVYIVALSFFILIYIYKHYIKVIFNNYLSRLAFIFCMLVVFSPYVYATLMSPFASKNIYEQQYQMHRFAVNFYKGPVAVNDIGYVTYNNNYYVLDLYGLGSKEVQYMRTISVYDAKMIEYLIDRREIGLAMIYDEWFQGKIPDNWERIAELKTSKISTASDTVVFYSTPFGDKNIIKNKLKNFKSTLPKGSLLIFP